MDRIWLPAGQHWGLNISHHPLEDAGGFDGGGHKIIWHTTEGNNLDGAYSTLKGNRDAPHFIIDPHHGMATVYQTIALNRAARALQHTGGPETNRANCIQVEIVGFASQSGEWHDSVYQHLGALAALIGHRFTVDHIAPVPFKVGHRLDGQRFVGAHGHYGHMHVPENDHTDPGDGFRINLLLHNIDLAERTQGHFG